MTFKKGFKRASSTARMMFNHTCKSFGVNCSIKTFNSMYSDIMGGVKYTTPGTYTWVAPYNVWSVHAVCIGGGGTGSSRGSTYNASGGGGGGLGWRNEISVVPGQSYTVVVGAGGAAFTAHNTLGNAGGDSYFVDPTIVKGSGGGGARAGAGSASRGLGGTYAGQGGGNGGDGGFSTSTGEAVGSAGGGTGGYSGNGGAGGCATNVIGTPATQPGKGNGGGGAGGAAIYGTFNNNGNSNSAGAGGGGVGILGKGADGTAPSNSAWATAPLGGGGGSGGTTGGTGSAGFDPAIQYSGAGGTYGGASGGATGYGSSTSPRSTVRKGGDGAVRIIWGSGRFFPTVAVDVIGDEL